MITNFVNIDLLADSIKQQGVIQPIIIRSNKNISNSDIKSEKYQSIISENKRFTWKETFNRCKSFASSLKRKNIKKESETNEKKLTQVKSHLEKQKGILGMIPKKELLELVQ